MTGGSGPSASSTEVFINFSTFTSYEDSGEPSLIFSAQHIDRLNVQAAMSLRLPQICPGEFRILEWSAIVPDEDILNTDELLSFAPSLNDIRKILVNGAFQFAKGMRSIRVDFRGKPDHIIVMKLSS